MTSPIDRVDRISAPLFVIHGENDPRVPVGEAHQIVEEAREQGVPVRELIFEDEGHGVSKLENRIETYTAVVEFLDAVAEVFDLAFERRDPTRVG